MNCDIFNLYLIHLNPSRLETSNHRGIRSVGVSVVGVLTHALLYLAAFPICFRATLLAFRRGVILGLPQRRKAKELQLSFVEKEVNTVFFSSLRLRKLHMSWPQED